MQIHKTDWSPLSCTRLEYIPTTVTADLFLSVISTIPYLASVFSIKENNVFIEE